MLASSRAHPNSPCDGLCDARLAHPALATSHGRSGLCLDVGEGRGPVGHGAFHVGQRDILTAAQYRVIVDQLPEAGQGPECVVQEAGEMAFTCQLAKQSLGSFGDVRLVGAPQSFRHVQHGQSAFEHGRIFAGDLPAVSGDV